MLGLQHEVIIVGPSWMIAEDALSPTLSTAVYPNTFCCLLLALAPETLNPGF